MSDDSYIDSRFPRYRKERFDKDLRHNWRDIQNKVIKSGDKSERPTSAPEKAWYFAEDESLFYQYLPSDPNSDEDGWVNQGGAGQSGTWEGQDIEVTTTKTDNIATNNDTRVKFNSPTTFNNNIDFSNLNISDDGTKAVFDYNGTTLEIDGNGVSVPSAPSADTHVARQADLGSGGGDVSNPMTTSLDAGGYTISNLAEPSNSSEAATKQYVDQYTASRDFAPADWGIVDANKNGYPGDGSGGDIMTLFHNNPNSTFVLPEGRYLVQSEFSPDMSIWDRISIIGKPHATLVIDDPEVARTFRVGGISSPMDKMSFQNLTLEIDSANNRDAGWGRFYIGDYAENKNLYLSGQRDRVTTTNPGDRFSYFCDVVSDDGVAIHQNINLPDGDKPDSTQTQQDHTVAFGSEPNHLGTNIWIGCTVHEYIDNGFYVKDGNGPNILIGCTANNCGGACFRIGDSDTIMQCQSKWNVTSGNPIADSSFHGVLLDADEASGTAVNGFRAIRETGENETVRLRTDSEQATYRDIYIENSMSHSALRISAADGSHENGIISLDNIRIVDSADANSTATAVEFHRDNIHARNMSVFATNTNSPRSALEIHGNRAIVSDSVFSTASADYNVILGEPGSSTRSDIEFAAFNNCTFNRGFHIYSDTDYTVQQLQVQGGDFRNVPTLFPGAYDVTKATFTDVSGVTLDDAPDGCIVDGNVMESSTTGTPTGSYDTGRRVYTDGWYITNPDGTFTGPL